MDTSGVTLIASQTGTLTS